MKSFRKTEDGLFICEECGQTFKICSSLSAHVGTNHGNKKEYYDKWVKKDDEGICKYCGKETKYLNRWDRGYAQFCCKKCKNAFGMPEEAKLKMVESVRKTCQEKYGVDSYFKTEESKQKRKKTCKERYGNENYRNDEKRKKTCLEKYGVDIASKSSGVIEKTKQTCQEKYGGNSPMSSQEVKDKQKQTCLEHFGVDHQWKDETIREKGKQTKKERYGDEYYCNVKKGKQTKKERYGDENYTNPEKAKQTCLKHFGVENPSQSPEIKIRKVQTCLKNFGVEYSTQCNEVLEKCKQTNLKNNGVEWPMQSKDVKEKSIKTCQEKYGVEYVSQVKEICEKQQKSAKTLKRFLETDIWYQGCNEYDFLEKHYERFKDNISRGPSILYKYKEKNKMYHSDFLIKSLNLVIECKNTWLAKRDMYVIRAKKKATIVSGYNYIMIVDKDYTEFNNYLANASLVCVAT